MKIAAAILLLVSINLWTGLQFWLDKQYAISGARRIPEARLLWLAMLGGSPGALLARRRFRHKTRKEPFSTQLQLITLTQIGLIIGFALF